MKINYLLKNVKSILILSLLCAACQKAPEPEQIDQPAEDSVLKLHAGSITGYKDGPALEAQFENPTLIAAGRDKSLFIVEGNLVGRGPYVTGGKRIRKISSEGVVSTFYDSQTENDGVKDIRGIAVDKNGCVFISDGDYIKKISSDGKQVSIFAGDGTVTTMKDGPALNASFKEPSGLAFDKNGCLYIMDTGNNAVRLLSNGKVTTIAGGNGRFDPRSDDDKDRLKDGIGRDAKFDNAQFLAVDTSGNIYVGGGVYGIMRKITPNGLVTTIFGELSSWNSDALYTYRGIVASPDGYIYYNSNRGTPFKSIYGFAVIKRSILNNSSTQLISSSYEYASETFRYPDVTEHGLNYPTGVVIIDKTLYICNTGENRIRKIILN